MADITTVLEIAGAITLGFLSLGLNIYFITSVPILQMKFKRWTSGAKNYGLWALVEPGKQINFYVKSFVTTHFDNGERTWPVAEESKIYRAFRAPFQINYYGDAVALSLEPKGQTTEDIRNPGKLHSLMQLYTAQADARARRKNKAIDPNVLKLLLGGILAGIMVILYYQYGDHGTLQSLASYLPQALPSKDALGNLIPKVN